MKSFLILGMMTILLTLGASSLLSMLGVTDSISYSLASRHPTTRLELEKFLGEQLNSDTVYIIARECRKDIVQSMSADPAFKYVKIILKDGLDSVVLAGVSENGGNFFIEYRPQRERIYWICTFTSLFHARMLMDDIKTLRENTDKMLDDINRKLNKYE